ncbi:MAG: hypothetical protein N2645_14580 [Clostridia bacterium]|nr:hypothetical protein [Clostridia bacterium]
MNKTGTIVGLFVWALILILELFNLANKINVGHSVDDVIFNIVIIVVTLVFGATTIFALKEK